VRLGGRRRWQARARKGMEDAVIRKTARLEAC